MSVEQDAPSVVVPGTALQGDVQTQSETPESTVLITEDEVLFATAAAQGLPREDHRWAVFRRIVAAIASRRNDAAAQEDSRPQPRHYPPEPVARLGRRAGTPAAPATEWCRG
jgi:hypothetical protein